MHLNRWLSTAFLLFILVETAGFIFRNTFAGPASIFSLLFSLVFFGIFGLSYIGNAFQAAVNPWVSDVEEMEGPCFNPMYMTWLFENDRLDWAAYTTLVGALFAPLIGALLFYATAGDYFSFEDAFMGFCVACVFLAVLGLSWFKGFCTRYWKTKREPCEMPASAEAEWRDKEL